MPYTFEEVIQNEMIREHRKRPQPRYPIWVEGLKVFLMFMGAACMISYAAYIAAGYEAVPYTIAFYVQPWLTTYVRRKWNAVIKDLILAVIFAAWLLLAPNLATGFTALGYVILLTGYQIIREFSYEPEREIGTCVVIIGLGTDRALARVVDQVFTKAEDNLNGAWLGNRPPSMGTPLEEGREWLVTEDEFTLAILCGYIIRWILSYWYALAAVVFALYLIKEDYMRRKEKRKYERLEYTETTEFYKGTAQKRRHRSLAQLLDRSEENLVRRAYYKRVKGEMGKTVERSDTPKQVGDKLPDAKELTKRYNEIRYKGEKIK